MSLEFLVFNSNDSSDRCYCEEVGNSSSALEVVLIVHYFDSQSFVVSDEIICVGWLF